MIPRPLLLIGFLCFLAPSSWAQLPFVIHPPIPVGELSLDRIASPLDHLQPTVIRGGPGFLASSAVAQDLSLYDKVLVPVVNRTTISGANGSTFGSSFSVYVPNHGEIGFYPAMILGTNPGDPPVGPVFAQTNSQLLNPFYWEAVPISKGRLFYFEKNRPEVTISAQVTATAPDLSTAVTPLPVVREGDLLTGRASFVNLPVTPILGPPLPTGTVYPTLAGWEERYTLRVYDWDSTGTLEVNVRLIRGSFLSQGAVSELRVRVASRDANDPTYPYYAEVPLDVKTFPGYCYPGLHIPCVPTGVIFEVEPVTPGARYYAFISSTDNATNHVAVWTPGGGH
jgi:hypothetical protein